MPETQVYERTYPGAGLQQSHDGRSAMERWFQDYVTSRTFTQFPNPTERMTITEVEWTPIRARGRGKRTRYTATITTMDEDGGVIATRSVSFDHTAPCPPAMVHANTEVVRHKRTKTERAFVVLDGSGDLYLQSARVSEQIQMEVHRSMLIPSHLLLGQGPGAMTATWAAIEARDASDRRWWATLDDRSRHYEDRRPLPPRPAEPPYRRNQ